MKRAAKRSQKFNLKYASSAVTRSRQASVPGAMKNYREHAERWEKLSDKFRECLSRRGDEAAVELIRPAQVFGLWAYFGELYRVTRYASGVRAYEQYMQVRAKYEAQGLTRHRLEWIARDVFNLVELPPRVQAYTRLSPEFAERGVWQEYEARGRRFSEYTRFRIPGHGPPDVEYEDFELEGHTVLRFRMRVGMTLAVGNVDTEVYNIPPGVGSVQLSGNLLIRRAVPKLTSVSPTVLRRGDIVTDFQIHGSGFDIETHASFNWRDEHQEIHPSLVYLSNMRWENTNLILYDVEVDPGCQLGTHDLYLTTPPPVGGTDILLDCLEIQPDPGEP